MELKDLILQTIDEFDSDYTENDQTHFPTKQNLDMSENKQKIEIQIDARFLELMREKTLVLFEGLQSSQTKNLSDKLDLVINYLEYQLSLIDEALEK
ncbi:hypothetical protein CQA57_02615 [Helicobacter anseris]|uniref:Campylobacter invasion antigen D C-terminal domain-containing protein n=1 Tax=Helicobacter anseris TaxID=375926 RepID=A0A3D8J9R3_9HELI|nr:hypothetical protein [Helicobacter anseris]RDU74178.1 hypothetical protein CQA57_02615 [Helicobacter anseris]